MFFTNFETIIICLIFFGYTYCWRELNGTTSSGVKTILKGILFECSNSNKQQNCASYLAISIKTEPSLHINKLHQFLTLDQIYVAKRFSTAKLLAPYVIEIVRGEPIMMCPLDYEKSVTDEEIQNELQIINGNQYEKRNFNNRKQNLKSSRRYSIFNTNLPIPFVVTTVNIFQKRYSTWWKLVPSTTVDSYSGFYANGNLFVWLKYHINIFQLSKSINRLKNFKLLMPSHNNSEEPDDYIIEPENALVFYNPENLLEESLAVSRSAASPDIEAKTFLENCPYNSSILCINILDDMVAGYTIKIRLPFQHNAYTKPNVFKVKIINAITDATIKDTVSVFITLINEGFEVHEFAVNVECLEQPKINQTYNTKILLPHVGETMKFILPFIFRKSNQAPTKSYCKIQVKTLPIISTKRKLNLTKPAENVKKQRIIMTRKIIVIPHRRCLCVWKCSCHCLDKLESNTDYNVCQELDSPAKSKAGLLINTNYYELNEKDTDTDDEDEDNVRSYVFACFRFALLIVLFMGFLGFCKAIVGICIPSVDKWGYDYLQPGRKYDDTSRFRHFLINSFYFILLPFLIFCNCFTPSVEDLLISNSETFMTKMYMHVYEVFYDNAATMLIIEETETSLLSDEY